MKKHNDTMDTNEKINSSPFDKKTQEFMKNYYQTRYNMFPKMRLRRLRKNEAIRDLLQETRVSPKDLVYPIFLQEGIDKDIEIESMPGVFRYAQSTVMKEIDRIRDLGIRAIILFGIPLKKIDNGKNAYNENGIIQKTIKEIKNNYGDKLAIITDVCLCQYTTHGHCGLLKERKIDNDSTLKVLSNIAVSHAIAGADIVAPSAMMDGQVKSIRDALDDNECHDTIIMGYSAKQSSSFFSPFRDAAHSKPEFGNRLSYQMSYANSREAKREIRSDMDESADIVMIKPAIPNLDLIYASRTTTLHPIAAYSVSGEYSMIKAAALNNWIDEKSAINESITAIKRAGADIIITYYAKQMAEMIQSI